MAINAFLIKLCILLAKKKLLISKSTFVQYWWEMFYNFLLFSSLQAEKLQWHFMFTAYSEKGCQLCGFVLWAYSRPCLELVTLFLKKITLWIGWITTAKKVLTDNYIGSSETFPPPSSGLGTGRGEIYTPGEVKCPSSTIYCKSLQYQAVEFTWYISTLANLLTIWIHDYNVTYITMIVVVWCGPHAFTKLVGNVPFILSK